MDPFIETSLLTFGLRLAFAVVTVAVGAVCIHAIDLVLLRRINLQDEIAKGNVAAAVYAGAIWIALALIVAISG